MFFCPQQTSYHTLLDHKYQSHRVVIMVLVVWWGDMLARPESPKRLELARTGQGTPGRERDLLYQSIPK